MTPLLFLLLLLLLLVLTGCWLLGQRFWQRSVLPAATVWARCRVWLELVLLASAWNLLVYCLTAVVVLPWDEGMGRNGHAALPIEWEEGHWNHELSLLLLSGVGGALTLVACRRREAALSWLIGCALVLTGFRIQRL